MELFLTLRMATSKVPPPRSKMNHNSSRIFVNSLSPKLKAAATGSGRVSMQLKPPILHASKVSLIYFALKYAGIVITQVLSGPYPSPLVGFRFAVRRKYLSTRPEISSGLKVLPLPVGS